MSWASKIGDKLNLPAPVFFRGRPRDAVKVQLAMERAGIHIRWGTWGWDWNGGSFQVDRYDKWRAVAALRRAGFVAW